MRPLKVTMTAFGPYKDKEVIDFTELKNNRLFVVSGNTGAGKTTIFDAICFALYGSASGEDRNDTKFLRSDFADEDIHTSVELEFELHGNHYRILRQLAHIKAGNKNPTGDRYEFCIKENGIEKPCVDRQKVSEINKKVESIMGLTKEQFSQIVMLPQGEFRKLLTSETENKEAILRKIFKTEPYRWISDRLKDKKKDAEEDYKGEALTRDRYIKDIAASIPARDESPLFDVLAQSHYNTNQIMDGLGLEAEYYQTEILKQKLETERSATIYDMKLGEFHQVKALNDRFLDLESKEARLEEWSGQIPAFQLKEAKLEKAERASKIAAYESQVNEWRQDERLKTQALRNAKDTKIKSVEQRLKAQNLYETEEKRKLEREETSLQLNRYNDILPTVKEIEQKKSELVSLQSVVKKLQTDLDGVTEKVAANKAEKDLMTGVIKSTEELVEQLPEKNKKLLEMSEQARILGEYLKYKKRFAELNQETSVKLETYQWFKDQYQKKEESWVNGQASILAAHLHDGKPCPVCGSIEHPNKADGHGTIPTKAELERAKKDLDQKDSQYRDVAASLNSNRELLEIKEKEVFALGLDTEIAEEAYGQLVEEGKVLSKEVTDLEVERNSLSTLKKQYEEIEKTIKLLDQQKEKLVTSYQEKRTDFETKRAVYQTQVGGIPEEIRVLAVLEQKISETQSLKQKLEIEWETAQKQLQLAKEAETKAIAFHASAQLQLDESKEKRVRSETQFTDALQNAQFSSEEEYISVKMSESEQQLLKNSILQFNQNLNTIKQQITDLQAELKDKTKGDLTALTAQLTQLKTAYDVGVELLRQSEQNHQKIKDLKAKILDSEEKAAELERQLNIINDLYEVISGKNSSRISFERYLQIEYLEEIIVAANERLKHLSNGQFLLMRSERQENYGRQSGLGLDVFDAYTGQTRDVKTLSGGEKFNASLCLALGMADVIQSFQGGVSIDTMFIDEGFGSLDEESLNKAIDTLVDLQKSGRMIGVISHVQELKNAIPAILEVKKTKEGYSQTEFVIK